MRREENKVRRALYLAFIAVHTVLHTPFQFVKCTLYSRILPLLDFLDFPWFMAAIMNVTLFTKPRSCERVGMKRGELDKG